jgi:Putative transmembrane protein (PGPGW)
MTSSTNSTRATVARATRTTGGLLVVLLGLALIPLPGPGLLVVIAGLALLARDHEWAARWLSRARAQASRAGQAMTRRRRRPGHSAAELESVPTAHLEPVDVTKGQRT